MFKTIKQRVIACCLSVWFSASCYGLALEEALLLAVNNDPYLEGSRLAESGWLARGQAAKQLPDLKWRLGLQNLPVNTLDFDQEPMTQFQLGVSQSFPRGNTRELKDQQMQSRAEGELHKRSMRRAQVTLVVTKHWFQLLEVQRSIALIESDRGLFKQLVDAATSNYISTAVHAQQYDVVSAQLEVSRLNERLLRLRERELVIRAALSEWLGDAAQQLEIEEFSDIDIPDLTIAVAERSFGQHPQLRVFQSEVATLEKALDIERQSYKSGWELGAQYGYREDGLQQRRSDLVSIQLSFDVPLLGKKRRDQLVSAAHAELESKRYERDLILRQLKAGYLAARQSERYTAQQIALYESSLLDQIRQQADAALNAYTNDRGEFVEVVRAQIGALEANLSVLTLQAKRQIAKAEMMYFLAGLEAENDEY